MREKCPAGLQQYHKSRRDANKQAIANAERIILRATGKPISYYSTRSRRDELVAFRIMFAYIAIECGASFLAVGEALHRNHTTIRHAYGAYLDLSSTWQPLVNVRNKIINYSRNLHQ